jgi:hypothetical protein
MPRSDDEASEDASHFEAQKLEKECENDGIQDAQKQTQLARQGKEQSPAGDTEDASVNNGT